MLRITVDTTKCRGYGQCIYEAEGLLTLDGDPPVQAAVDIPDDRIDDVERAIDVCPMQALSLG